MNNEDKVSVKELYKYPEHSKAYGYLSGFKFPWEALSGLKDFILTFGKELPKDLYTEIKENVWVAKSAVIAPTASLNGPCIIGERTEVRQCAFIRGSVIIGDDCVIGNSCEFKNAVIFDSCQVPHFNYVGDTVMGYKSHMGAGSITSNVKSDKTPVKVRVGDTVIETGRKKFGAMLSDYVEVGCNSVLNPGTVIGTNTNIYPLSSVRGYVEPDSIFKREGNVVKKV